MIAGVAAQAADLPVQAPAYNIFSDKPIAWVPSSGPAVDGLNGKLDIFGGSVARHGFYGTSGSATVPVAREYGVQFDGMLGSYRNSFLGAAGVHAFWRDPGRGLLGVYGSYAYLDRLGGARVGHFGIEGAVYLGRWAFEGVLGVESGNSVTGTIAGVTETIDLKTRAFDRLDVAYYATDNLRLSIGHRYLGGRNLLALGGEWAFATPRNTMASLFAEARLGNSDSSSAWAGLRVYFGQHQKTLIRRHREDDPLNGLSDQAAAFGNASGSSPANTITCGPGQRLQNGVCINT